MQFCQVPQSQPQLQPQSQPQSNTPSRLAVPCVLVALLLLLVLPTSVYGATEVYGQADVGNLGFGRDRDPGHEGLPTSSYPWGVTLGVRHPVRDAVDLQLELARHHLLGNSADLLLSHRNDWISLGVGTTVGLFNNEDKPFLARPGVLADVTISLGTVGFLSLAARAPLYDSLDSVGEYRQRAQQYEFGVYLPNVVLSLYSGDFRYDERTEDDLISDRFRAYEVRAHVFQKNVPYRVDLSFGYHDYEREFPTPDVTHAFGALVSGTGVTVDLRPGLSLNAGLQAALYAFGREELLGDDLGGNFLFRASTGFTWAVAPPHS